MVGFWGMLPLVGFAADAKDSTEPESAAAALPKGQFRGTQQAVRFDVSRPLREMTPKPIVPQAQRGGSIVDMDGGGRIPDAPQDADGAAQRSLSAPRIPAPTTSFDGPPNVSGVAPPDPAGDVGPEHYVAMSNLFFQIFDLSGASLFGPAANNTLWTDFGGACEAENSGDPIVLYDQLADRWLLTQFTSAGPDFFNCVALSQSSDPTGAYYRWAFTTGTNFPDYPKYGVWTDAYVISTREFQGNSYVGVGAYAIDRAQMVAGNPNPTVIDFFVDRSAPAIVGDGLLPADIDGTTLPPPGAPHYMLGTQDDGGPYGAANDALLLWKFDIDFAVPGNSSFTLTNTIPTAAFDTQFSGCTGGARNCIPQPGTANRLDIQSYRQRPLHRLAYRNFGTHEALVTNQSVEGDPGMAGIRWWELRDPDGTPVIFQESTYVPGATDGIHRWMGSAAMDSAGNMALAYSASSGTVFPSIRYSGRLATDPINMLDQGEGEIHAGTGSQTGGGSRWGDYTSLNVDPVDDCTFWHVNEYLPTTSERGWQLRIGAFRFDECGSPGFYMSPTPGEASICAGTDASYEFNLRGFSGFNDSVTLSFVGEPAGTAASFTPNPVSGLPAASTFSLANTGAVPAGDYTMTVTGMSASAPDFSRDVTLRVFDSVPAAPALIAPADMATMVDSRPSFSWTDTGAESYVIEVATDAAFTNIVYSFMASGTTAAPGLDLASRVVHYWRVRPANICGDGSDSVVFTFTVAARVGDCALVEDDLVEFSYGFEAGANGWTSSGTGDTWAQSDVRVSSGAFSWFAVDPITTSDQRLVSPPIVLQSDQAPMTLRYANFRNIESQSATACWDAGILEISTNDGATWTQIDDANLLTDPYNGTVNGGASTNPLAGLQGWCGSQEWTTSIVDLDAFAGQTVRFGFRMGSDASVGVEGWYIDDVSVQSCRNTETVFRDGFEVQ